MRGKGEGSLFKRADGMWVGRIELPQKNGERRNKRIVRKSKAEAQRALTDLIVEKRKHGDLPSEGQTVAQWFEYWADSLAAKKVRPRTLAGYRTIIDGWIVPNIGKVKLSRLTAAHIRRVTDAILETPKVDGRGNEIGAHSSTYALLAHRIMSASLTVAEAEGRITRNPAKSMDAPRKAVTHLEALTLPEAIDVLQWAAGDPSGVLWATYLLTGARRSEVIGLTVDRVTDVLDFSWQIQRLPGPEGTPDVPADFEYRHLLNGMYLVRPKTKAGWRIVPLVEPLRSILLRQVEQVDNPWGLVFTFEGRPYDPDFVGKLWRRALEQTGIEKNVRLHDLRHTTVDLLYEAEVPEGVIQEIVGHSTRAMTRAYKSRGNRGELERAMLALSQLVSGPSRPGGFA